MELEVNRRYQAVLYTVNGEHSIASFDDFQHAHDWAVKEYGEHSRVREAGAAVYDQEQGKRTFVLDPHCNSPNVTKRPERGGT